MSVQVGCTLVGPRLAGDRPLLALPSQASDWPRPGPIGQRPQGSGQLRSTVMSSKEGILEIWKPGGHGAGWNFGVLDGFERILKFETVLPDPLRWSSRRTSRRNREGAKSWDGGCGRC
jgi:hypothetical protein